MPEAIAGHLRFPTELLLILGALTASMETSFGMGASALRVGLREHSVWGWTGSQITLGGPQ